MRISLAIFVIAWSGLSIQVHTQIQAIEWPEMPDGSGRIEGTVVTDAGAPAGGAVVTLKWLGDRAPESDRPRYRARTATADALGHFAFGNVPELAVQLSAALPDFLEAVYGQAGPGRPGRPIRLDAGETLSVRLGLARGAVIEGTVTDPGGNLAAGIDVHAFRLTPGHGTEEWMGPDAGSAVSDRTGAYRIANLPPGRYVVFCYREFTTYFRDRENADAADRIELTLGAVHTNVDLQLRLRPVTTVSGVVQDEDGRPAAGARVRLVSDRDPMMAVGPEVTTGSDGAFTLTRVERGRYDVMAYSQPPPARWARATVSPDGRTPLQTTLRLGPAASVHGRIVAANGAALGPAAARFTLFFAAAYLSGRYDVPGVNRAVASPEFTYRGVPPGRYVITINAESLPPGWQMQSEMVAGRDALDFPFEITGQEDQQVVITVSDRTTGLSGAIVDERGQPSVDHTVVVFAADDRFWTPRSRRILTDRPDQHGRYRVHGLPAGEYVIGLAPPDLYGEPSDDLLRDLRTRSGRVILRDGELTTYGLQVRGAGR